MAPQSKVNVPEQHNKKPPIGAYAPYTDACLEPLAPGFRDGGGLAYATPILVVDPPG